MKEVLKKSSISDISPVILGAGKFSSTAITPNSEKLKNQYAYRFMIMESGSATLQLGEMTEDFKAGDMLYLVPGIPYKILNTNGDFSVINLWFDYFTHHEKISVNTVYNDEFDLSLSEKKFFSDGENLHFSMLIKNMPRASKIANHIVNRKHNTAEDLLLDRAELLTLICAVLSDETTSKTDDAAAPILEYINQHICENITGESLSEVFHYHKNHICRLVAKATGFTLHQWILHEKKEKAEQLLSETDMTMTEVASYLSLYDYSHLHKILNMKSGKTK